MRPWSWGLFPPHLGLATSRLEDPISAYLSDLVPQSPGVNHCRNLCYG